MSDQVRASGKAAGAGDVEFPDNWTADDVRRWLLRLFGKEAYSELPGWPSLMWPPLAVQKLFDRSSETAREHLKGGTILALREWRAAAHGFDAVKDLSQTAALLRATNAVPVLGELAIRLVREQSGEPALLALSAVVACLSGFAPAPEVDRALRQLFYDRHTDPSLAGQLFVGLCRCDPATYPSLVPHFLHQRQRVGDRFAYMGAAFLDAVPPATLIDRFSDLDHECRESLAEILSQIPDSEIEVIHTDHGPDLVWINRRDTPAAKAAAAASAAAFPPFGRDRERVTRWLQDDYNQRPASHNINAALLNLT